MKTRNIIILLIVLAALGGVYWGVSRPKPTAPVEPKEYVWMIEQEDIDRITLSLPREDPVLSQSFIRIKQDDKFPWFFDDEARSPVDSARWGGGIPLLLSGPGADRVISRSTMPDKLAEYGFNSPTMLISLEMSDGSTMTIKVGDQTPNGSNYYVQAPSTTAVATVDYTWYDVLARIVTEPPYAAAQ